jgi:hypothetical protein
MALLSRSVGSAPHELTTVAVDVARETDIAGTEPAENIERCNAADQSADYFYIFGEQHKKRSSSRGKEQNSDINISRTDQEFISRSSSRRCGRNFSEVELAEGPQLLERMGQSWPSPEPIDSSPRIWTNRPFTAYRSKCRTTMTSTR